MKYKNLYFSLLRTYLKSDVKLNITVFLISLCSVFSFLLFIVGFKSTNSVYNSFYNCKTYRFCLTDLPDNGIEFLSENFPKITFMSSYNKYIAGISFVTKDGFYCVVEDALFRCPPAWENLYHNINPAYSIKSGRDFTTEELENNMNKIIVDSESGFSVGDTFTVPSDNGNIELEVIGESDHFVVPLSFYIATKDKDLGVYQYFVDDMVNIAPTGLYSTNMTFERDLTEEETEKLNQAVNGNLYVEEATSDYPENVIFYNLLSGAFIAVASTFTAIQLLTIMLHLAENCSEQLNVIKTTGCKNKYAVALLMCVTLTYIIVAFIMSIALLPLFLQLTKLLRLEYIPNWVDYTISFVIFTAIILISTLPGLGRIVKNPLRKRGG